MSDKPRRPKGTGSIKREYFRGTDRKDIATKLARAIAERDSGLVYDAENMTVGEYLDRWLDAIRGSLRERTWQRHEEITRIHLKPNIGKIKLDRLSALQVQSLYRLRLDSGLSSRTVQIIHTTLHKALKQAVRWSLVPRNVAEAVTPGVSPKGDSATHGRAGERPAASRKGRPAGSFLCFGRNHRGEEVRVAGAQVAGHRPR